MRINGHEILSGRRLPVQSQPAQSADSSASGTKENVSLSARLAGVFRDKGFELPSSQILALEAELLSLGLSSEEITGEKALRTFLLRRHGIPVTRELLAFVEEQKSVVFNNAAAILSQARSLLGEKRFTGENRKTIEVLVQNLSRLLNGEVVSGSTKIPLLDTLDLWMYNFESKLLALLEGQPKSVQFSPGGSLNEIELAVESLLNVRPADSSNPEISGLLENLRKLVAEFRGQVAVIDLERSGASQQLKAVFEAFTGRMTALINESVGLSSATVIQGQSAVLFAELFEKQIHILEKDIFSHLIISETASDSTSGMDGRWRTYPVWYLLRNSGMSFEWQLLSWYRSGRDPQRFFDLMQHDLKGILMALQHRLRKNLEKGKIKKKLELLEKESHDLVKHITNRQISNILNEQSGKRGLYLELPLSREPEQGYARIVAGGSKEPEKDVIDPQNFTLSFEVETSGIGTVTVFMTCTGKTVTLDFELENSEAAGLGTEMSGELRESLETRGFIAGSIDFKEPGKVNKSDIAPSSSSGNLDIVG